VEVWKIYLVTNLVNGNRYVGQTKKAGAALDTYFGSGYHIKHALHYYGKDRFKKQILHDNILTKEEADRLEEFEISSLQPEYNIAAKAGGGNLGEAWLAKLRQTMQTKEYREAMSKAQLNPSTRFQKSQAMKKARTQKISEWSSCKLQKTSYVDRDAARTQTMSTAEKKRQTWRDRSEEQQLELSQRRSALSIGNRNGCKKVRCVQTGEVFSSIKEAAIRFDTSPTNLGASIRRKKPARCGALKGLQFEYL